MNIIKDSTSHSETPSEADLAKLSALNPQAQNNAALAFLANRFAEQSLKAGDVSKPKMDGIQDKTAYKIYVKLPPEKNAVEYEQLEKSAVKAIFNKNGITLSKAALEDVAEKITLDFSAAFDSESKQYVYNPKDGLMIKPQTIDVNGLKTKGYEIIVSAETEKNVLSYSKLAQETTASGRKAFSELSGEERLKMTVERTGKYLPQDTAETLKLVDPRSLVAGVMVGATASALVKRGIITSNGLLLVGGAVSLAQLLKYGGDAQHVLDLVAQAKKPADLDKAAQALAELTKNGAVDLFLTVAGYGAAKIAPKIGNVSGKTLEIASEYADDIARISKQKLAEFKGKVEAIKDNLPVIVTTH